MLEFPFPPPHQVDDEYLAKVRGVIADVLDIQRRRGNRAGNQEIIDRIGVGTRVERDESYWREALDYHLGILYAHVGDPESAAYHFERSGTHPSDGGNRVFSDHQRDSLEIRRRQELAMARGIPSLVISSMPRSASASLTQTLSSTLNAPIMRVSSGRFPNFYVIPRWLNSFSRGGAVLHDHFGAVPHNLQALRDGNIHRVFVRVRDPRSAAASAVSLNNKSLRATGDVEYETQVIGLCEQGFIPWIAAWIAASSDTDNGLNIRWLAQPSGATAEMAREILTTLAPEYPALEQYLTADIPEIRANFVVGNEGAWRQRISEDAQARLWSAIPQNVKELLALKQ